MKYKKGDRVRHATKSEWGLGQVLQDSSDSDVRVFFEGPGEKTLSLEHAKITKVSDKAAKSILLDNLKDQNSSTAIKYQSLPQSVNYFLEHFPEGFQDRSFAKQERDYKINAHELAKKLLGKTVFKELINENDQAEVCKRALKVVNATNLVFPNEKMALKDGLKKEAAQVAFSRTLFELVYGNAGLESRFIDFSRVLDDIEAGKWTIASYFLFIFEPDKYMFLKPTVTQHAAELCGFEINYSSHLNWLTYKSLLDFANYLKNELSHLRPKDMIDVQSFMWVVAPNTYKKS